MPTASRLVAAVLFGALAYYTSTLIHPLIEEYRNPGALVPINTIIGILCGWVFLGPRTGDGYIPSFGYAMTALGGMLFWALLIHGTTEMVRLSLRKQYGDAVEAVGGVFLIAFEYIALTFTPMVMITLLVGSTIAGIITEFVGRRYS